MALELEDFRFEAVPEGGGDRGGGEQAEGDDGEVAGDAVFVHAEVEPSEVDEDGDVGHVEAVADAAIEGERAATEDGVDGVAGAGGRDGCENCSGEAEGECRVKKCRASGDGGGGPESQDKGCETDGDPSAATEREGVEAERDEAAEGDAVEMEECVGGDGSVGMVHAEPGADDERGEEDDGEHPGAAKVLNERRPEDVVLLFDGEGPRGTDGWRERGVDEVLYEEEVGQPRSGFDGICNAGADEPGGVEIDGDEQQDVERPDAEDAAAVEVAEVVGPGAGFEKDGCDEEAGEDEEEVYAGPAPEGGVVDPCADEAGMAVVEDDDEDRDSAQSLEFRDVGGEPGWAL